MQNVVLLFRECPSKQLDQGGDHRSLSHQHARHPLDDVGLDVGGGSVQARIYEFTRHQLLMLLAQRVSQSLRLGLGQMWLGNPPKNLRNQK